jgi:hypothetical protein
VTFLVLVAGLRFDLFLAAHRAGVAPFARFACLLRQVLVASGLLRGERSGRVVVRGASSLDPSGMPLIAVLFPSIGDAGAASERIGDYLAAPNTLVLVPPDARFTVQRSGSWIIFFQRTPSGDPDPAAADLLETTLTSYGEAVTIPR